jgi:hypothetical protein
MKKTGSCHCGKVQFEIQVDSEITQALSCNCSICRRKGTLLTFLPESKFTLSAGEDALSDYQFNKKIVHHLFCSHCGISAFSKATGPDGIPSVAVNVRCLDDVDLEALKINHYDGKNH